jgi:predicted metalloprotease with PDZ domain
MDAVYAAGDFRVHHFAVGKQPVVLAIRGRLPFTDSAAVTAISSALSAVRNFWHDDSFPYFLVTWGPFDRDRGSTDGTAFTSALWMFTSRLDSLARSIATLTHESFHAWDPRKMGIEPPGEERRIGWFHEGFTAYYADVIAYRGGLIPLSEVVANDNKDLRNVSQSTSSYTRGRVIALWLDGEIRARSQSKRSLDDVMHDMIRGANRPLTLETILSTTDPYLSSEDQALLGRAAGGEIDLDRMSPQSGLLAPCVRVSRDSAWAFDLGFDGKASTDAERVIGVQPGGPAYAAGLRDGQGLVSWGFYNGNSQEPATFTIKTDAGSRDISYYPRGAGGLVPQLHIASGYARKPGLCGAK